MYKLVNVNGKEIGLVDEPYYIKKVGGDLRPCGAVGAMGFTYKGTTYNLAGTDGVGEEYEFAIPVSIDLGEELDRRTNVDSIVFTTMTEKGDIDDVTATEHAELFQDWEPDMTYKAGDIRKENNLLYRCLQSHNSQADWAPSVTPSLWKSIGDPTVEYPEWSQPIGAMDAYNTGDKVAHNDKNWVSTCDNNVWEPGVYGWEEVSE